MKPLKVLSFLLLFVTLFALNLPSSTAQNNKNLPNPSLATPYDALYMHQYYLRGENYDEAKAAQTLKIKGEEGEELAVKLKQIFDGKGLRVHLSMVPEKADYVDSISEKSIYHPFPNEFPEVYLERGKTDNKWQFSQETVEEIPNLHKKVYPFGSDMLLNLLPKMGQRQFWGLSTWQYLAFLILTLIVVVMHLIASRVFGFIVRTVAKSRLGSDHFDKKIANKVGVSLSFLWSIYFVLLFLPVLQFPVNFNHYFIVILRLLQALFIIFLILRCLELTRSYLESFTAKTENTTDDHLLPIAMRIFKVLIIGGGIIQMLHVLGVNITALIAGLSLGGLALALAAQETLKNLLGSMMIFADKPFKVGDMVTVGAVTGTIVDVGFRSTRIRTPETSIISIPNGALMNETINNLGQREQRRFNINIGLAYHTPLTLIEKMVEGVREIVVHHPHTNKERYFVHLNNMNSSSLDILVVAYFTTNEYPEELKYREELIFAFLRLAKTLGAQIAFPSSSLYIETMPEKKGLIPNYEKDVEAAEERLKAYLEDYKNKFHKPEDLDSDDYI